MQRPAPGIQLKKAAPYSFLGAGRYLFIGRYVLTVYLIHKIRQAVIKLNGFFAYFGVLIL